MENQLKIVREKALICGFESLSDEELLTLLCEDAEAAHTLLSRYSRLSDVVGADIKELRQCEELGMRGAVRLSAAKEFGRRAAALRSEDVEFVGSSDDIKRMFAGLGTLHHEEFWVVCLNSAGRVLDKVRISQGGVNCTQVDCRLICKRALELLASSVVLVHNHPSGVATASNDDVELTNKVSAALALFNIRIIDHVILAGNGSFSFVAEGLTL